MIICKRPVPLDHHLQEAGRLSAYMDIQPPWYLDHLYHLDYFDQWNHSDNRVGSIHAMINQKDNCRICIINLVLSYFGTLDLSWNTDKYWIVISKVRGKLWRRKGYIRIKISRTSRLSSAINYCMSCPRKVTLILWKWEGLLRDIRRWLVLVFISIPTNSLLIVHSPIKYAKPKIKPWSW